MFYVLGFRTASAEEVPEILYIGTDGEQAVAIAENAPHPRVARMNNPVLYPVRHWSEEAAIAFAADPKHGETPVGVFESVTPDDLAEAVKAAAARVNHLEEIVAQLRAENANLSRENERLSDTAAAAYLPAAAAASPSEPVAPLDPPAPAVGIAAGAESEPAADDEGGPQLLDTPPSDPPPAKRRGK